RFLGHVERCAVILHLLDGTIDDLAGAYRTIREELTRYGHGLTGKREIIALNKIDAIDSEALRVKSDQLRHVAGPEAQILALSGATGAGVPDVLAAVLAEVRAASEEREVSEAKASALAGTL
ncbi:MAG: GTPase ObgE, partial [Stellaceae bacterium]